MGQNLRRVYLKYNSEKEQLNKEIKVEVIYVSNDVITQDEYEIIHTNFCYYINNNKINDIVHITKDIKNMLKDFKEKKLIIEISSDNYYQYVSYVNDIMDYCHVSTNDMDNTVSVMNTHKGISINYKNYEKHINSYEDINFINNEINKLLNKVCELRKFEKQEKNVKVKRLNSKCL